MTMLLALIPLAQATSFTDLLPYLALVSLGFLVGAWGQSARSPLAVAIGITLIMGAVIMFLFANGSGDTPKLDEVSRQLFAARL